MGDKDINLIIQGLEKKFPDFFQTSEDTSTIDNDLFFYKKYGYKHLDNDENPIIRSRWVITHAPRGTSIGYSFQREKGLKDYIDTQI